MATYREPATTETDPEAPITAALMKALADNPTAIAEGASGAPRIVISAQMQPVAGGGFVVARFMDVTSPTASLAKTDIVRCTTPGTLRATFSYSVGGSTGGSVSLIRFRTGATTVANYTSGAATVSVDFSVQRGDMIFFEAQGGSVSGSSVTSITLNSSVDAGLIG